MTDEVTRDDEDQQHYQAFVRFLREVAEAKTVAGVCMAAGMLLQDLGEEPGE